MASNYGGSYEHEPALSQEGRNKSSDRKGLEETPGNHTLISIPPDGAFPSMVLDPIQYFPSEISTLIIRSSLPLDGDYSPRILELTTVSHLWQSFLLSTPTLWSELYINAKKPDLLATVATSVHLSGKVALEMAIYDGPTYDWGRLLPILLPACDRIISLTILGIIAHHSAGTPLIRVAKNDFFRRISYFPRLQKLAFVDAAYVHNLSTFESLDLPSTIRLTGTLALPMPPSARPSVTAGRFFDIDKYQSFSHSPPVVPLFQCCSLSLGWLSRECKMTACMREETLSHLKLSINYLREQFFPAVSSEPPNSNLQTALVTITSTVNLTTVKCGLEQLTHIISSSLCRLAIAVNISQLDNLVHFVRLLVRLEKLQLEILVPDEEAPVEIAASSIVVYGLRELRVKLENHLEQSAIMAAQGPLRNLFSAFTTLYPGVADFSFWGDTWPFFVSSYLESLTALKSMQLILYELRNGSGYDTQYDPENYSITLRPLEELEVRGPPSGDPSLLHYLYMPNLLNMSLKNTTFRADLESVDFPSLRRLTILVDDGESYNLNPLYYPILCEMSLMNFGGYEALRRVDILSFSRLSSIRLRTYQFTNPEGNYLCISLLYNPEGCPSLQELHCEGSLEWDILFLMLERRNFGLKGIKRIHTVTLPFVPYPIHQTLALLLAGEDAEKPPLVSVSLEATREVLFDPTVPGCCWCLKNMFPGCTSKVHKPAPAKPESYGHNYGLDGPKLCLWTPDELYPEHECGLDTIPDDIRDWIGRRRHLVDAWKSSYKEYLQEFSRQEWCGNDLRYAWNGMI